jgi:hypothetical protein
MAKNREMLKEAIAEAKAVKEMAIANAKAALEEAFTPQLKSMLSLKLQEMEKEDLEEEGFGKATADSEEGFGVGMDEKALDEEKDEMMEVDLEELLAELELEEGDEVEEGEGENLYEAEEEGEEEESEGDMEMGDLSDDEIKDMIEDVIAQMIKDGELEAGPEFESEEGEEEGEEMEMDAEEEEEEVDLAELLREIEEMEEVDEAAGSGLPSGSEVEAAIKKLAAAVKSGEVSKEEIAGVAAAGEEEAEDDTISEAEGEDLKAVVKQDIENLKKDQRIWKVATKLGISAAVLGMASLIYGLNQDLGEVVSAKVGDLININPNVVGGIVSLIGGTVGALGGAIKSYSKGQDISSKEYQLKKMDEELNEALSTIETLKAEINEINLLNAKLLYSNKIFKAKNLNENQKVKVLSSFDKAKNVGEVKMVYETLNEGIKVAKNTIKENLGRASKSTVTPTTKQPIVESNDVFARMQKLAGLI